MSEQSSVERSLRASTARLAVLRQALERGAGLEETLPSLEYLALVPDISHLSADGLTPSLRAALCALAGEVVAADVALAPRMEAVVLPTGRACAVRPGQENREMFVNLLNASKVLHSAACSLQHIRGINEARDTELTVSLVSACVAIVSSSSLAYRLLFLLGDATGSLNPRGAPPMPYFRSLHSVLEVLAIRIKNPQALSGLRAMHFTPAKILACLRRILWQEMAGLGSNTEPGVCACVSVVLLPRDDPADVYAPEIAAIERDRQLQCSIVAYMEGQIRRFVEGESGPASDALATGFNTTICAAACNAVSGLGFPALELGVRERACANTNFIPMLRSILDQLLEGPCDLAPGLRGKMLRSQAVAMAVEAMHIAYSGISQEPGPSMAAILLQSLQRGAAASIWWLQQEPIDPAATAGLPTPSPVDGVGQLLAKLTYRGQHAVNCRLPGQLLEAITTCESLLRMVALLPESLQLHGPGLTPVRVIEHVCTLLGATAQSLSGNGIESPHERNAVVMLVETAVKCALRWMGASSRPSAFQSARGRLVGPMLVLSAELSAAVIGHPDMLALASQTVVRRWQGAALAVLHSAAASEGVGGQPLYSPFNLLLTSLLHWKPVRLSMLSSKGCCGTLTNIFNHVLETTGPASSLGVLAIFASSHLENFDSTKLALALARTGVLSKMAQWGEANCGRLSSSQDGNSLLHSFFKLASTTIAGCELEGLQAAFSRLRSAFQRLQSSGNNLAAIDQPSFWRRLRVEVIEPLAQALADSAAAAEEDGAKQLEVAVEAAEGLATRACAHTGCTTILGASEAAMPRGKLCSSCRLVRYCGPRCQKADWPAHKAACRELAGRRAAGGQA